MERGGVPGALRPGQGGNRLGRLEGCRPLHLPDGDRERIRAVMKEARFNTAAEDGVQCQLCPHHCRIKEGGRGVCRCISAASSPGTVSRVYTPPRSRPFSGRGKWLSRSESGPFISGTCDVDIFFEAVDRSPYFLYPSLVMMGLPSASRSGVSPPP